MLDSYTLWLPTRTLDQILPCSLSVHDYATSGRPEIDAKVRSGDFFIMLATSLDTIAAELTEINPSATSLALAKLAEELEYIQKHYAIIKKPRGDRLREL